MTPLLAIVRRAAVILVAGAATVRAQSLPIPSDHPRVRAALDTIKSENAWTLAQQVSICQIAAPPFKETRRGAEFARRLRALGLANVRGDRVGNVIAERRGTGSGPAVLIQGHLDTVFPAGTDVTVKRTGTRYAGPGIGDDLKSRQGHRTRRPWG